MAVLYRKGLLFLILNKIMEEIYLNYQELSFIMGISSAEAKEIFCNELLKEKATLKDQLQVSKLKSNFPLIKSLDPRYEGQNSLLFNLEHKKQLYKRFLNEKSAIKRKKLSGGKSIFYKILPEEDLLIIKQNLEYKWNYVYGKKPKI